MNFMFQQLWLISLWAEVLNVPRVKMWWQMCHSGFTHQNSLDSTVCFLRFSLSAMEMVDHSPELWKDRVTLTHTHHNIKKGFVTHLLPLSSTLEAASHKQNHLQILYFLNSIKKRNFPALTLRSMAPSTAPNPRDCASESGEFWCPFQPGHTRNNDHAVSITLTGRL